MILTYLRHKKILENKKKCARAHYQIFRKRMIFLRRLNKNVITFHKNIVRLMMPTLMTRLSLK